MAARFLDDCRTGLPPGVFDNLTALTGLNLATNALTALPPGVFDNLTALTRLSLHSNSLTALPVGAFDNLTALTLLTLTTNALTVLPEGVFEKLTVLRNLRLASNPGSPFAPVANAGEDVTAPTSSTVTLSGSATGPWGSNVTFLWVQVTDAAGATELTSGAVTLTGDDTAMPSFSTPTTGGGTSTSA